MMNKIGASRLGIFFLSVVVFLCSCHSSVTWVDDHIDARMRSEIGKLNKQIVGSLAEGDYKTSAGVLSDKLLETNKDGHFDSLFAQAKGRVTVEGFKIRNQFYLRNSVKEKDVSVMSGLSGDHDYSLRFKTASKENFVTVGYFEDSLETLSLVTIYGKEGNDWKLNMFHMGIVKLRNKDAFDWYQRAADHLKDGSLVDAANDMNLCQLIISPANGIWHYQKEKDILALNQRVSLTIGRTYTFPLTVNEVSSKPKVFQEFPQVTKQGYFPMVLYTTGLGMSDTVALRKECDDLHRVIGQVFHGLDKNNDYIIYRVFEKMPTDTALGVNYEFVRKTK